MPGLFDDVLAPPKRAGLFDDVLAEPALAPVAPERPGFLDVLGDAVQRGATSALAGTLHAGSDFVDQTVGTAVRGIADPLGLGDTFDDPLGAATLAATSAGVEREINADRVAVRDAIGRPSLGDFADAPLDAAGQYGLHLANLGGESLPVMAAAIATRNPELAAGLIGGVTGAQEYTDLRGQGVDRLTAAATGLGTGAVETAGEAVGLPFVMGRGGGLGSVVRAALAEGGQEVPVQLAQQALDDQATGRQTPALQQLGDAVDAFLVGSGIGAGGRGLSLATDAVTGERAPEVAPDAPLGDAIPPELLAAAAAELAARAPQTTPSEDTADLDALLLANLPAPEPAPAAATPTPPGEVPQRARLPAQASEQAPAEAPPTAAPAAQLPAVPNGSRAAGGDLAPAEPATPTPTAGDKAPRQPTTRKPPDLLRVIASGRGLDRESFRREYGVDPAEFTRRAGFGYLFRKQGGMTPDELREFMQESGYLPRDPEDAPPQMDTNDAFDLFDRALGGEEVFAEDQWDAVARVRTEAWEQAEREWEAEFGAVHPDVAPEDYAVAANVADIAERARAVGVDEFDIAPFSGESDADYVARLEQEIEQQEARRGTEQRADQADRGERVRGQAAGTFVAEDQPGFFPAASAAEQASPVASQTGLFAPPTSGEQVAAAKLGRDTERNGLGRELVRPEQGEGDLLAGTRPKQEVLESAEPDPMVGAARTFFGTTNDPREAGYILPDGAMLDFTGRHYSEDHPSLRGQRNVDHRELTGENRNGDSLDDLFRLKEGSGSDYMQEFMGRTSAMRVDFRAGVASIMGQPTPAQVKALSQGLRGDYAALSVVDPESGRIIDEVEIDYPTPMKVQRFFAQAQGKTAAKDAPLFNTERTPSPAPTSSHDKSSEQRALAHELSRQNGRDDARRLGLIPAVNAVTGQANVPIVYVRDLAGLPANLRTKLESQNRGRPVQTAAVYDPKDQRVYLVTGRVTDPARAAWHAAHEIAGHHGLRALLGDKLDSALDLALQNPTVRKVAEAIARERRMAPKDRLLAAEEALAELAAATRTGDYAEIAGRYGVEVPEAQRDTLRGAIARFIQRVKALFGKAGFSDADVYALVENAWQAARKPVADATMGGMAESTADRLAGTKVVDANGEPLTVYHGTPGTMGGKPITKFVKQARGGLGGAIGFWFASERGAAQVFARERFAGVKPQIVEAKLAIRNPKEYDGHRAFVDAANARPGATIEERLKSLRRSLVRAGHDGVVVRNSDTDNGGVRDDWVAFEPEQVVITPAADAPAALESVDDARARAEARRNEAAGTLPVARGSAGWNYDNGQWLGRKGRMRELRANLQDKMLAWRDVQGQIESQLGAALPDAQNVYRLENLMHGRVSNEIDRIEREQVKPLMEAMQAAGVKPAQLEEYLYARHAAERNAQIATINPAMPDGGSGMTNAEAQAILAVADRAKLDPLARMVDKITRATRRRLLGSGLITQDAFDAMEAQYEHYVPLRGQAVSEDADFGGTGMAGRGLDSRGKLVRNALGRGAGNRAQNILAEIIGDAERAVITAEKARVGRAVMRIVLANPNPALWTVEPVQTERALDANGEVYERVVNDWSDPAIVAVRHKGQLYKVQINAVPLAKALNHVGVDQLGTLTRYAGAVNRYFSAILTKYNPAFTPVNASRDALFGLTGLAAEHGEAAALDAALHYPQAAAAAFQQARGKQLPGEWGEWAAEFAAHGGKTGYVNLPSTEDLARKIGTGTLTGYSPQGLNKATRAIGEAIGTLNDAVENALRLSAFVTLRKRGKSAEQAAAYAKDLTVNFNRKGFDGSTWNAWFLFYNASLQGAHRTSKLLRSPKTHAYLGMLAGAQVLATLAAMGMRDDNDEPLWNKVPDHVKRRNLVIVTGDGGLLTIPMPYGFNLFPYVAGRITEAVLNADRGDERASDRPAQLVADTLSAATQSFSPVPLDTGVIGLVPQALRIPLNVWANRNDFGNRIRSEEPFSKSDVPRASMGRPDTLEVFKLTATGLNRLGGGDELTPPPMSLFDVAPEDLEYLLGELTGGPGNLVVDIATSWQKATGPDKPEMTARDIPIAKRFVSNIDEQAAQQALFYQRRETIDRSLKRVRHAYRAEGPDAAEALLKASPELKGAAFKRRKRATDNGPVGSIIETDGSPQIIVADDRAVYGAYKAAEEAINARRDHVEAAFVGAPSGIVPNEKTRQRDAFIRTEDRIRQAAQANFNDAWVRDVVGTAE